MSQEKDQSELAILERLVKENPDDLFYQQVLEDYLQDLKEPISNFYFPFDKSC